MTQVLTSLNAVTSDANGDVLSFNTPKFRYSLEYIATIPSGSASIFLEGSLDGINFATTDSISLANNAIGFLQSGGTPVLFIRARVSGLASGRTMTALVAVGET